MDHDTSPQLRLFASAWALAGVFHVWFSVVAGGAPLRSQLGAVLLGVVAAAVAVLLDPSSRVRLGALAALELWSVVLETPMIGNHWVLVGLVDVAILLSLARVPVFAPAVRLTLIGFYVFAAFSKLNAGFFDYRTSCATFYFDETAASVGLDGVRAAGSAAFGRLVVVGTALIELSIPVLLAVRRTRLVGVAVGLVFHSAIALDQTHFFADFSSALTALFLLFLPAAFADGLPRRWEWGAAAVAVLGTVLLVGVDQGWWTARPFENARWLAWVLYDLCVLVAVGRWFVRRGAADVPGVRLTTPWMAVVPALVVLNGLAPYFELKTGYGWNMYSNLQTVDGDSNHFVVARSLPLTHVHEDLVRIVSSSDPGLQAYADLDYDLPYHQLRVYLSHHPDVALRYVRDGVEHDLARASDDPALVEPVPVWQEKLVAFRAVDARDPSHPRCQQGFLPAH